MNPTTLAILGAALVALYLGYLALLPKPYPGIPYNKASARRFLGDIPAIQSHIATTTGGTFNTFVAEMMRKYNSPLVQVFARPLSKPVLVLGDYEEAYEIFVRNTKNFDRSRSIGNMLLGLIPRNHIHLKTNTAWKEQRKLHLVSLSPSFMNGVLGPVIQERVDKLVELWRIKSSVANGRPWSASEDLYLLAVELIMVFTFGGRSARAGTQGMIDAVEGASEQMKEEVKELGSYDPVVFPRAKLDGILQATLDMTAMMGELRSSLVPQLRWSLMRWRKRVKNALRIKEDRVQQALEKSVEKMNQKEEFIAESTVDLMVACERDSAAEEGRQPDYFSRVMFDEVAGFLIAGYETTGTTLSWGVKYLADYPQTQTKLRRAIETGFPVALKESRKPTIQEIAKADVPYLEATVQEILRFANPAAAFDREAQVDTEILGHTVPQGTLVACILPEPRLVRPIDVVTKRDAASESQPWDPPDMALFIPDRWIVNGQFNPMAGPQVAFGLGIRACPGRKLAYLEIKAALVAILWSFELLECPPALSGYGQVLVATQKPTQCYVRLREITRA